jgi:hypothetical protein
MAKPKRRKNLPGPNPMYPTQTVLKKLATILQWAQSEGSFMPDEVFDDPELVAWLAAMKSRGYVEKDT